MIKTFTSLKEFFTYLVKSQFPSVNFKLIFSDGNVKYVYADIRVCYCDNKPPIRYYKTVAVRIDSPSVNCREIGNAYLTVLKESDGEKFLKYMVEHHIKKVPFGITVRTTDGKCFRLGLQSNFAPLYSKASNCANAVPIPFDSSVIPFWLRLNRYWFKKHGYLYRIQKPSEKKVKTLVIDWIVRDFTANKDYHFKTEEEAWVFAKKLRQMGHAYQLIRPTWSSGFKYGSITDFEQKRPDLAQTIKPKPLAVTSPFESTVRLKQPVPKEKAKTLAKHLYQEVTTATKVYERPMTTTDYTTTLTFAPPSLTTPILPSLTTTPTIDWKLVGLVVGGVTLLLFIGWLLMRGE